METIVDIIAISPDSGWAFVIEGDKLFLFRPPYIPSHRIEAKDIDVEKAFQLQIFVDCQHSFKSMDEAIKFLENYYIELLENIGITEPSTDELKEFLKYVDDDTLLDYLKRAKDELIPKGDLVTAVTIVKDIIKLKRTNPEINSEAGSILQEVLDQKEKVLKSIQDKTQTRQQSFEQFWTDKFSNVTKEYSLECLVDYTIQVREEQVFPIDKAA